MRVIKQKERFINLPYNDVVKSLNKSALIIYANLINMRDINRRIKKNDKEFTAISNKYIKNKLKFYGFYISDTEIKDNLKILRDYGLIDYCSNGIKKGGDFVGKIRYVSINNVNCTLLTDIKVRSFVKTLSIQAIRVLMYLFYIVDKDIMIGCRSGDISNSSIAEIISVPNKKVKIYLEELKDSGLITYESKDNNKIRTITILV
jgi:hypothetical protein